MADNYKSSALNFLSKNNYLESYNAGYGAQQRLKAPLQHLFLDSTIKTIKKAYLTNEEKGGIIIGKPKPKDDKLLFIMDEVVFVKNTAQNKYGTYRADEKEFVQAKEYAYANGGLPFFFHTHPTEATNPIVETLHFKAQMDTSDADKRSNYYGFSDELFLRLPEILVFANGQSKHGLFVSVYGGMVAPLNVKAQTDKVYFEWLKRRGQDLEKLFTNPDTKPWAIAASVILGGLMIASPKNTGTALLTAAAMFPNFALSTQDEMNYVGICHTGSMLINVPKISDDLINADEKLIQELIAKEKAKKAKGSSGA